MDSHQVVTQQGWLSRLGGAFKAMVAGVVLLAVALGLQFWNEGRTLKRDAALGEGRAQVQAVSAQSPSAADDGRLVHVSGAARAAQPVSDAEFGVSVPALALRRRVEMYQWQERRDKREESQVGGGTRTVTTYRYEQRWDDEEIDSTRFNDASDHVNPGPLPYVDQVQHADDVRVGGFVLAPAVTREIDGWIDVPAAQVALPPNLAASFRADGDWLTTSADADAPAVGDVRVRFEMVPAGVVSIVAAQRDATLQPYMTAGGEELLLVEREVHTPAAMFDVAGARNSRTGWLLRGVGFVIAWMGFGVLLRPLVVLADVVPLFGRLAGMGSAIAAAVLAALLSVFAIGSGWLWHRPWLLGLVVFGALAAIVWLWRRRATDGPPPAPQMAPPPPPPPA